LDKTVILKEGAQSNGHPLFIVYGSSESRVKMFYRKGRKELTQRAQRMSLLWNILKYGSFVEKEKALPLIYEDIKLDIGYKI